MNLSFSKIMSAISLSALLINPTFAKECVAEWEVSKIFQEAMDKQIDVQLLQKEGGMIDGYIRNAEKITNPELEHFTTTGDQYGQNNVTSETRLWFHLQTNNKRHKRGDVFRADRKINEVNVMVQQTRLVREIFLTILRNKQLLDEQTRLKTIHEVIDDLLTKYQKVDFLSAEQSLEKGSLEIANEELELNQIQLQNELAGINKYFQTITRAECRVVLTLTRNSRLNTWPDLQDLTFVPEKSLFTKLSELALEKSKLEFRREQAMAYPDLRIGPMWQLNKLANQESNLFGVGLIIPIPSFDLNQGMKQATSINIDRSQKRLDFNEGEMVREFNLNHRRYMALYKQVMDFRKKENFQAQILENKSLFKRGLVSIPLFLTYKREQLGLINKVHYLELDLAAYLSDLYILNNISLLDESSKVLNL